MYVRDTDDECPAVAVCLALSSLDINRSCMIRLVHIPVMRYISSIFLHMQVFGFSHGPSVREARCMPASACWLALSQRSRSRRSWTKHTVPQGAT